METPSKDGCWFPPLEAVLDQWKDHRAGKAGATVCSWHWPWCYVIRSNHFSSTHLFSLHLPCPFKLLGKGPALCGQWWNNIFILLVLQSCLKLLFVKWPLDLSIVVFFIFPTLWVSIANMAPCWCVWLFFHYHCTCFDFADQCPNHRALYKQHSEVKQG